MIAHYACGYDGEVGRFAALVVWFALACSAAAQDAPPAEADPTQKPEPVTEPAEPDVDQRRRTELNLLGRTNTASGESRRNENVQFNLVDNNALKELNARLGVSATIVKQFDVERRYFATELGNPATAPAHVGFSPADALHGRLRYAHQNSAFSARSFFQVGDVQPARENEYGVALSGPLWEGGHFSVDGGQKKIRGQVNGNVLVPKPDERTALATDPELRSLVQRFLSAYPAALPNRTDINERALNTNSPQRIDEETAVVRFDQEAGPGNRLYFQYAFTGQQVDAFQLVAGQNPDADIKSHRTAATWNRAWSPATTTDLTASFDRIGTLLRPEENAVGPLISTAGLTALGPGGVIPLDRAINTFRYAGRLQQSRGRHDWKAGFELMRRQLNGRETDVHRGFFSFGNNFGNDAITNLRLGLPTQHIVSIGDVHRGYRNWAAALFLQDKWSLGANWTLHFGLSLGLVAAPNEVNGRDEIAYGCDCNNISPRFGFARRLPNRWGVLRGAYGLTYGQIYPVTYQQVRLAVPGNLKIVVPDAPLVDPLGGFDGSDPNIRPTTYVLAEGLVAPYSHQYNFSWQLEPTKDWSLELGYVGSRSHKLLLMAYRNRGGRVEGIPHTSATLNIRRAVDGLADIRYVHNGSIGYYDAARASLVSPELGGLSVRATYWFSKAIDLGSGYTNTAYDADSRLARGQWEFDQFQDMKGLSDFDQPHAFLWTATYRTPSSSSGGNVLRMIAADWELSAVTLFKSGTPFTVDAGGDAPGFGNVDGNGGDRPNLLDASVLGRTIGHPDKSKALMPRSAFEFMALDQNRGSVGRNTFRKGPIRNVNAALARTFVVQADHRVTLRAEAINLSNTAQFAEPGFSLANPNFGEITNTLNDGRTFRFGLSYLF